MRNTKSPACIVRALLLILWIAGQFISAGESLPQDPKVKVGKLENGLTYYIRENQKPENRVELRLVVKVGSLHEDEDQQGLAHFLEHMAFNGTKHFEKQELVDYLERIGTRFGADLNASTFFDNTTYKLMVPTDDEDILNKAFLIMQDWASAITLDEEEIEKERGVVIEEWRGNRGAQARISDKQVPEIFYKSRYAERLPIGKVEILKHAPADAFQRFYHDWYRPDLMAVVVVGALAPERAEKMIRDTFAGLKNPPNPRNREAFKLPDHEETRFSIESDPELTRSMIQILYKHPVHRMKSESDFRTNLSYMLNQGMLNNRMFERTRDASPPFIAGFSSFSEFVETADVYAQGAVVKEGGFEEGLLALLSEARRAKIHGFTASELERQKKRLIRQLERAYEERDKTNSGVFVSDYVSNFLYGKSFLGIEKTLELSKELLPTITLEQVNNVSDQWTTDKNRVILVTGPEKEGVQLPNQDQIIAMIDKANQLEVTAYEDEVGQGPLLPTQPTPGKVVSEKHLEGVDAWEWKLSNGITVVLKPTDFKNDQILIKAYSPGGSSLVSDEDYIPALTATSLVEESGLGNFDAIQLEKKLADKSLSIAPFIGDLSEGFDGFASPRDVETMLQLLYLYFHNPRVDEKAFESTLTRWRTFVENRAANPGAVFRDEMVKVLYNNHPRSKPFTLETLEAMNGEKSLAIFKDRFADAGEFNFIFVGNFELEKFKPLVEKYIASLPATGRNETWRDVKMRPQPGKHKVEVSKGLEPKALVRMLFTGDAKWGSSERHAATSLNAALRITLREILREDMGGVYGVGVSGGLDRWPVNSYQMTISFSCDPEKAQDLIKATLAELERATKEGFDEKYLEKVRETQLRGFELNTQRNEFWAENLDFYYTNGLDPNEIPNYPEKVKALQSKNLQDAARLYYNPENYLLAILWPQDGVGKESE